MDRNVVAAYAVVMLPLGALLSAGCDSRSPRAQSGASASPAILAELGHASPGPWRRLADAPVDASQDDAAGSTPVWSGEGRTNESGAQNDAIGLKRDDGEETVAIGSTDAAPTDEIAPERASGSTIQFANRPMRPDDAQRAATPPESEDLPVAADSSGTSAAGEDDAPRVATPESTRGVPNLDSRAVESTERSTLPWAGSQARTTEISAAVRRADERARRGFELAQRGALYSARSEFIAALQIIAQANDTQQSTQFFTKALAAGLRALAESSDFVRQNPRRPEIEVGAIVARHVTPVLKGAEIEQMAPLAAASRYYDFAQEQLAAASAREVTGSIALFGLGKVTLAAVGNQSSGRTERTAQAMVLFQAAVLADSRNFRAANELGVLLAETGNLPRARTMLVESATTSNEPAIWHNLALIHKRLGEEQLADRALAQAVTLGYVEGASSTPQVQWVDPTTFATTGSATGESIRPEAPAKTSGKPTDAPTNNEKPAAATAKKGVADWLPWNTRR